MDDYINNAPQHDKTPLQVILPVFTELLPLYILMLQSLHRNTENDACLKLKSFYSLTVMKRATLLTPTSTNLSSVLFLNSAIRKYKRVRKTIGTRDEVYYFGKKVCVLGKPTLDNLVILRMGSISGRTRFDFKGDKVFWLTCGKSMVLPRCLMELLRTIGYMRSSPIFSRMSLID